MSAADMQLVGCPLPAAVVDWIESMRSRVAMLRSASMDGVGTMTSRQTTECITGRGLTQTTGRGTAPNLRRGPTDSRIAST